MRPLLTLLLLSAALLACKPEPEEIDRARAMLEEAPTTATVKARPDADEPQVAVHPSPGSSEIVIPVAGVSPDRLEDTYEDARSGGRTHEAIDILAETGTPVVAATDGTIIKLFESKLGGITVYQYDRSENFVLYYAHLDRYAPGLAEGDEVRAGDLLGFVGTSGNAPAGVPHLHFQLLLRGPGDGWWEGEPVNPFAVFSGETTLEDIAS